MSSTNRPTYLAAVHELLAKHFNEEELKTLCFGLGLDYDNLPAAGKDNKARELVLYLERYNRITELKTMINNLRPDMSWPTTPPSSSTKQLTDFPPISQAHISKRRVVHMSTSPPPIIRNNFPLTQFEKSVLERLFSEAALIEIKNKFDNGYGGCSVLSVRVDDEPQLVKLGPRQEIKSECEGFKTFKKRWSKDLMVLVEKYVIDKNMEWGGLVYNLAGDDIFNINTLYKSIVQASSDKAKIASQLDRLLFEQLDRVWLHHDSKPMKLKDSYEQILPANLLINFFEPSAESPPPTFIDADNPQASKRYPIGTYVCLNNFTLMEIKEEEDKIVLTLNGDVSYRVKLQIWARQSGRFAGTSVGEKISDIYGVVVQTRHQFLQEKVEEVLDYKMCAKVQQLSVLDQELKNPIMHLDSLLHEELIVKKSRIHGDLNLENILVLDELNLIKLIDFRHAREDHILHDILRLETGIITHVLPKFLKEDSNPRELIFAAYQDLHTQQQKPSPYGQDKVSSPTLGIDGLAILRAIRRAVQKSGWLGRSGWREYYLCLVIYLLGSLKYNNVSKEGHALAFWGAACILQLSELFEASYQKPETPPPKLLQPKIDIAQIKRVKEFGVNGSLLQISDECKQDLRAEISHLKEELEHLKYLTNTERFTEVIEYVVRDVRLFNCIKELRIGSNTVLVGNVEYSKDLGQVAGTAHHVLKKIDMEYRANTKWPLITIAGASEKENDLKPLSRSEPQRAAPSDDLTVFTSNGDGKIYTRTNKEPQIIVGDLITLKLLSPSNVLLLETSIVEEEPLNDKALILKYVKVCIEHKVQ